MSVTIEKQNKSILQDFVRIIEQDKRKEIPVIKFIRQGFLEELTKRFSANKKKVNFVGITGESASGKSTFVKGLKLPANSNR